jgi:heat-inducible transcriptional repressor
MASLEAQGYLDHPHTSAGRVPTIKGYRFYIERMMSDVSDARGLSPGEKEEIDRFFDEIVAKDDEFLIESASNALAELTNCAIVSTNLTARFSVITKVELIPTGRRVYVLLLITSEGSIKNRVCRLSFDLTDEQMDFFTQFLNENIAGLNIGNISDDYIESLAAALGGYMMTLSPLLKAVAELSKELTEKRVLLKGETNLIAREELQKNEIIKLLESRNVFSELLDTAFSGINVMLGKEKDTFIVENSSIITGSFSKGGQQAGSFGVIGPMRLDYKKIIPYIEYFADKVTDMLSLTDDKEEL